MKEKNQSSKGEMQKMSRGSALLLVKILGIFLVVFLAVVCLYLTGVFFKIEMFGISLSVLAKTLGIMGILIYSGGAGYFLSRLIRDIVSKKLTRWQKISTSASIILVGGSIVLVDIGIITSLGWLSISSKLMQILRIIATLLIVSPFGIALSIRLFSKDKKFPNLDL